MSLRCVEQLRSPASRHVQQQAGQSTPGGAGETFCFVLWFRGLVSVLRAAAWASKLRFTSWVRCISYPHLRTESPTSPTTHQHAEASKLISSSDAARQKAPAGQLDCIGGELALAARLARYRQWRGDIQYQRALKSVNAVGGEGDISSVLPELQKWSLRWYCRRFVT